MKSKQLFTWTSFLLLALVMGSCQTAKKNDKSVTMDSTNVLPQGSYGNDLEFLAKHGIHALELKDPESSAKILIIPDWQGRVLTSTAGGDQGHSFGWINYKLIESAKPAEHINAFGGEERLWLGPEGGPFSLYFAKGAKQEFSNWYVPKPLDTAPFEIEDRTFTSVLFTHSFELENYSGTNLKIKVDRNVEILSRNSISEMLGLMVPDSVKGVAYRSKNTLTNSGTTAWTKKNGLVSIWMLSMMVCSPNVTVFIPYKQGDEKSMGPVASDNYFGKVPSDRLITKDGMIYFKADGKYRSKIGLSWKRAGNFSGSYDASAHALTILWCNLPVSPSEYVNSKWGDQENPFEGDALNSYNDGPLDDGTQMGPFYEIESSSPAAALKAYESITHEQRVFHFEGNESELSIITQKVFGISIESIKKVF
jgi:hypothetical protein